MANYLGKPIHTGSSETTTDNIPFCDFCKEKTPAVVDGKTTLGPWGGMCPNHFKQYGVGLGLGYGQKLIRPTLEDDKPAENKTAFCSSCLAAAEEEGAPDQLTQEMLLREMGSDIADHLCDAREAPDLKLYCACACGG